MHGFDDVTHLNDGTTHGRDDIELGFSKKVAFSSGLCHDSDKFGIGMTVVVFMKKHRKCDIEFYI